VGYADHLEDHPRSSNAIERYGDEHSHAVL